MEILRDWVIVIGGSLAIIVIISGIILGLLLVGKINALTDSIKDTINFGKETIKETTRAVSSAGILISIIKAIKNQKECRTDTH